MARILCLRLRLAHVEEGLAGHGRVFDLVLRRHEGQHRFHEGRLAGRRGRLDDDGQGLVELARDGGQVADQFVGGLADDLEVGDDAVEQMRIAQQVQGGLFVLGGHEWLHILGRGHRLDVLVLQFLQLEQHAAQVGFDGVLLDGQFAGGLADEAAALLGGVEVEGVHEQAAAA